MSVPQTSALLATCHFGLESVVARELTALGFSPRGCGTGRVIFAEGLAGEDLHRAIVATNLHLRTAGRILIKLAEFPVGAGDPGFDALFEGVRAIPWEAWCHPSAKVHVHGRTVRSAITSEPALQRATKRAIVERLRTAFALDPSAMLAESGPTVSVEIALLRDVATLTLDTSGEGLHKRGYRTGEHGGGMGDAAIKETLAAGLVLLSVWRPGRKLVDPFCGSGTIAIEAAMIARNIAPGLRRRFDAEHWLDPANASRPLISPALFEKARAEAEAAIDRGRVSPTIIGSDINDAVLKKARANAKAAGVENDVRFERRAFADLSSPQEFGCIVSNPPYGLRIGDDGTGDSDLAARPERRPAGRTAEARPQRRSTAADRSIGDGKPINRGLLRVDTASTDELYRSMPATFRRLPTWSFHILTARLDLETIFGQAAMRRRKVYNATLECCFYTFLGPRPPGEVPEAIEPEAPADAPAEDVAPATPTDADPPATTDQSSPPSEFARTPAPVAVFGGLSQRSRREAEDFARCLASNLRHLRKYPARGITCFRVYERDVTDVPLIIDRYEDHFHAVEYERPHDRSAAQQADWWDLMRGSIAQVGGVPPERIHLKEKHRQRGLSQHERLGTSRQALIVQEGGLRFEVNLEDYVDTGLFLDHRLTRNMLREQSAGKRVLNLFCYTGSFTVYAAAGGAASTVSVDLSNTYLAWAERNLSVNGLAGRGHAIVRSDVVEFLQSQHHRTGGVYDLVVLDPPTFSNSSSTEEDWEVNTGHARVLGLLAPLMSPGGVVYFSNNFRRFKLDEAALAEAGFDLHEISNRTVPPEYRNRRIHRCWKLTLVGQAEAHAARARRAARSDPGSTGQPAAE
ncbi:MAG: class I SAM-dependent methyltransferase [Phycisphaerales bacterium]